MSRRAGATAARLTGLVLTGLTLAGCASGGSPAVTVAPAPSVAVTTPPGTTVPPVTTTPPAPSRARAAVDAADPAGDERDDVTLGIAVLDRVTGQTTTNDEGDSDLRAASVAKLFTVLDVLVRRESGELVTNAADEQRIRRALGPSDDDAMNALWSRFGGPTGIQRVSALLGLSETRVPDDESQWGEVETSARDVAAVYGYVLTRLTPPDRALVLESLAAAPPTAADGFDQAFGLLDPSRRGNAAAKQGWLCCFSSSVDLHSTGLPDPAGRYVLVLLSNQPYGYPAARTLLDDAAGAARDALAG